jgi:hypothetical protein
MEIRFDRSKLHATATGVLERLGISTQATIENIRLAGPEAVDDLDKACVEALKWCKSANCKATVLVSALNLGIYALVNNHITIPRSGRLIGKWKVAWKELNDLDPTIKYTTACAHFKVGVAVNRGSAASAEGHDVGQHEPHSVEGVREGASGGQSTREAHNRRQGSQVYPGAG